MAQVGHTPEFAVLTEGLFVRATAPAGWYEIGNGARRWFDGHEWTGHFAPVLTLAVAVERPIAPPNHGFHLIMTIMTIGMWSLVWLTLLAVQAGRVLQRVSVPVRQVRPWAAPPRSAIRPHYWPTVTAPRSTPD